MGHHGSGLSDARVSTQCPDCKILLSSSDYQFHLNNDDNWRIVDTVDDRGCRSTGLAWFSTLALAETFLLWTWVRVKREPLGTAEHGEPP